MVHMVVLNVVGLRETMRILPRLKNGMKRIPKGGSIHPKNQAKIEALAIKYGVSQNYVKSSIIDAYFETHYEPRYYEVDK